MKVIVAYLDGSRIDRIVTIPDSAILKNGKPLFLPTLTSAEIPNFELGAAFRINRLGKCINRKFADRYIDAVTLCLRMRLIDTNSVINTCDAEILSDNAITLGDWVAIENNLHAQINGTEIDINDAVDKTLDVICEISRFATLKMGDICVSAMKQAPFSLNINDIVVGKINNSEILHFKIK